MIINQLFGVISTIGAISNTYRAENKEIPAAQVRRDSPDPMSAPFMQDAPVEVAWAGGLSELQATGNITPASVSNEVTYMNLLGLVMTARYLRGMRAVEDAINGKDPKVADTAYWNGILSSAEIADPVVREKIRAKFEEYVTTNPQDPADPSTKFNEYGTEGMWGMVYDAYAAPFLEFDASLPETQKIYGRLLELNSQIANKYSLPDDLLKLDESKLLAFLFEQSSKSGISVKDKERINEMLIIVVVLSARCLRGMRAVEESLNGRDPKVADTAFWNGIVSSANIPDAVIREKIRAKFEEFVITDPQDPADPSTKFNDYGTEGMWGMVYDSYAGPFVKADEGLSFDLYQKVAEVNSELCENLQLAQPKLAKKDFDEVVFLKEIKALNIDEVLKCVASGNNEITMYKDDAQWPGLRKLWTDYLVLVCNAMGYKKDIDEAALRTTIETSLNSGRAGDRSGISFEDMTEVTQVVYKIKHNENLNDSAYFDQALRIHGDETEVPSSIKKEDFIGEDKVMPRALKKLVADGIPLNYVKVRYY